MSGSAKSPHKRELAKGGHIGSPGFSVLEAIIAIAILAIAFLPLLALQEQMTQTTISLERNARFMEAKRSALAYVRTLNPMRDPQGNLNLGPAIMHWTATPISQERPVSGKEGDKGRFIIALYNVEVTLTFDAQRTQVFSVHATGWRAKAAYLSNL